MRLPDRSKQFLGSICGRGHKAIESPVQNWRYVNGGNCVQCISAEGRKRTGTWIKTNLPGNRNCPVCGTFFHGMSDDKFCSRQCMGESQAQEAESKLNLEAFLAWSPDMAYALGLFHTDGCLSVSSTGSWLIRFDNTDLPTVQWWHAFVGSARQINCFHAQSSVRQPLYDSQITSQILGDQLVALGMRPRKSWGDLHIPDMPEDCLPHYVRGLIDGDGCICLTKRLHAKGGIGLMATIASNSDMFRKELQSLFLRKGWHSSNVRIQVSMTGSDAERLCLWIYGCHGQRMERKHQLWDNWVHLRDPHGGLICESRGYSNMPSWHMLLGTQSDLDLAKASGVHRRTIAHARRYKGIPLYRGTVATL